MPVKKAFWDHFWVAKFFFRAVGIIPIGGTTPLKKSALSKILLTFPLLCISYLLIPEINYILFSTPTTENLLDAVGLVIGLAGVLFRAIVVAVNRYKIERLLAICETLWDHTVLADCEVTSIWAQRARLFSTGYFCIAHFAVVTYLSAGVVKQLSKPENSTIRYYPFLYPENSTPSPEYEIKYAIQIMIGHVGMTSVVAADMTGTLLAMIMCGQFALIQSWLIGVSKKHSIATRRDIESSEQTLEKCIRRHQVVLQFCAELEEAVHHINLAQIIPGICVLAISGAQLAQTSGSVRHVGSLVVTFSGIFFACWPGDSLSTVSSEVAAAAYDVPWYDFSFRGKTTVAIMLMRSQRPVKLTAGKFVALSLETFSSIVSTSASYFMVLYRFE